MQLTRGWKYHPVQLKEYLTIFHISSNEKEHAALLNISLTAIGKNRKSHIKKIVSFKSLESVNLPTSQQMEN